MDRDMVGGLAALLLGKQEGKTNNKDGFGLWENPDGSVLVAKPNKNNYYELRLFFNGKHWERFAYAHFGLGQENLYDAARKGSFEKNIQAYWKSLANKKG